LTGTASAFSVGLLPFDLPFAACSLVLVSRSRTCAQTESAEFWGNVMGADHCIDWDCICLQRWVAALWLALCCLLTGAGQQVMHLCTDKQLMASNQAVSEG